MLHDVVSDPGDLDAEELYVRYLAELAAVVEDAGVETVAAETGLDRETLRAIRDREASELTLEDAAAVFAVRADAPDAADVAALARDELLLGMTNAVMDVERVAAAVDGRLEPKEIQSKVEGRYPMTLREFAMLRHHIDREGP